MLRSSPRVGRDRRTSPFLIALAATALGACNAIFGIEAGEPTGGTTGATGATGGTSSTSSTSSTGGRGGTGGTGSTTSSSSTGGGGAASSSSAGGGGAASSSSAGGGGAASSSSTGGGGAASSSSSTSSSGGGGPPGCGLDAGVLSGTGEKLRISFAPDGEVAVAGAYDPQGDAVVLGSFNGTHVNLGGGNLQHGPSVDNWNVFLVKYGPNKNHLWSKAFGGDRDVVPHSVAVAPNGDIWITGLMYGSIQFGALPTLVTLANIPNEDYPDAFIVKFDASGTPLWAKRYGNLYIQAGVDVVIDSVGNAVVSGVGWDFYDIGGSQLGNSGTWSSWVAKIDPSGNTLWSQAHLDWEVDVDEGDYLESVVAVDKNDDVLFASVYDGQDFFDSDLIASYGPDGYVLKLQGATGDVIWKTFLTGGGDTDAGLDGDQWPSAIATDPCTGDVYVAGGFTNGIQPTGLPAAKTIGPPDQADMFLIKLAAADGAPVWLKTFGDAGYQEARSVVVDGDGNVTFAGFLVEDAGWVGVDFGPVIGTLAPNPAPIPGDYEPDAFIAKFDSSGNGIWGKRYGDTALQRAQGVAVDAQGHLLLVGALDGTMAVPGLPPLQSDYFDAFMVWLSP